MLVEDEEEEGRVREADDPGLESTNVVSATFTAGSPMGSRSLKLRAIPYTRRLPNLSRTYRGGNWPVKLSLAVGLEITPIAASEL